ncbi:hypothetical protein GUJ93_ZPchr0012g19418 [Zizania palustris]|uniref:Uncharacterized protein n=1 Tax=Zizania palustris TaxID=103762 RepID=A0A8J5WNW5_ZIZPA|nr:hypothetical protein GUJ93_ZPchr0012g19418 [Zizania palustris]
MPPSPSLRRSPAKEISHKRGHSFGSTVPAKSKDDELTLFSDMQKNERESFLLESSDNFDETISKLSYFPDLKLGVNVARRGENHDFLNVDGEKNDYDWLLTPPETPLFRSLDDDEDQRAGPAPRGRAQTKPISISRSSTMENAQRSSRSSASPSRLSLSPRSSSNTALTRTRSTNSSSRCSPPLSLQSSTPSRRSSTPPANKTLTPPRRSPSPASRRINSSSSGPTLNGTRGASPGKANRRSSSPKLQGWQSSDPGFSFNAPPNLRTSLSDRSVSHSRGGSPSSFSGLNTVSRGRRQSMSPTPSRRAASSHSTERDLFSSWSKASATSSFEDDLDSMQSVPINYSSSPAVKKSLAVMKTRTIASSQKTSKSFSPSSAPKRSFDSAVWLMDHRKAPQNMFRPLLSSVPVTTFGAGKGNIVHRPVFSHNCSVTTSSNASSEHCATFGPCVDIDHEHHGLVGEFEANDSSRIHEEIFMFDKSDELNDESNCHHNSLSTTCSGPDNLSATVKYVETTRQDLDLKGSRTVDQISCGIASSSKVGLGTTIQTIEELHQKDHKFAQSKPYITSEACPIALDCARDSSEPSFDHRLVINESPADCLQRCLTGSMVHTAEEKKLGNHLRNLSENISPHDIGDSSLWNNNNISSHTCINDGQDTESAYVMEYEFSRHQKGNRKCEMSQCLSESESDCQCNGFMSDMAVSDYDQLGSTGSPCPKVENTEGNGISVLLLQKTRSNKWPIVEGRPLVTTNIHCLEPYYATDNISLMKRSIGQDISSAASSIDLGSSRQSDVRFECLKSGKKGDYDKSQISCQSISSVSDMSISGSSTSHCPQSYVNGDSFHPIDSMKNSASRTVVCTQEHDVSCKALSSAIECWSVAQSIVNDDCEAVEDGLTQKQGTERIAHDDNLDVNTCSSYTEVRSNIPQSPAADGSYIQITEKDSKTSAITDYSIDTPEHPGDENSSDILPMLSEAVTISDEESKFDDCCVPATPEEGVSVSATEASIDEGSRKQIQRCFTLEEATDTILFCSSIVHDLAYKAATIGLEREQKAELADAPRPTVTIVQKSIPREDGLFRVPHRRAPKPTVERKRSEVESITDTTRTEVITKDPAPVRSASEITTSDSLKPPKMESKCNCTIM